MTLALPRLTPELSPAGTVIAPAGGLDGPVSTAAFPHTCAPGAATAFAPGVAAAMSSPAARTTAAGPTPQRAPLRRPLPRPPAEPAACPAYHAARADHRHARYQRIPAPESTPPSGPQSSSATRDVTNKRPRI